MRSRRSVIGGTVGIVGALAGCSELESAVNESSSGLNIEDTDARNTSAGNLEIGALVENSAPDTKSKTLVGQVDIEGGDTYSSRTSITVPGNDTRTYTMTVDIPVSRSISGGRYQYDAFLE